MRTLLIVTLTLALVIPVAASIVQWQPAMPGSPNLQLTINLGSVAVALAILGAVWKISRVATKWHEEALVVLGQHRMMWDDYEERRPDEAHAFKASTRG